ncbi:bifunctional UDP-N-acetylglucosamine diphosphorylase/glucosamine-1-phosphate N-acetyltransferase GlmU [Pseudonocardia acaciae]|uniref:bifunctional UDP-N-acetylglucosamine diphosphorylase/glucosamine-1-phosphate N-acetyltransferase GlmU n=1 Tax=Pseudonocardia acaciae TaxID=551276 RepID=UPI001B807DC1|nr:bifunctional UDP-N-acetylglucosamine diphosphorylase/glucosamine-1-phosphate N-acetyltransferase GlmU [Pseudonocardia acaciae]
MGTPEAPNPAAVVVLAAGEGRRMRSARPKVLHEIAGRALLGHAVHAAAALAPEHLVVVAGHGRDQVREYLGGLASELSRSAMLAIQDEQRGTGHAVACALDSLPALSGPVMVTYGDVPLLDAATLRGLLTEHAAAGNAVTVLTAVVEDPTGYGRVLRTDPPDADPTLGDPNGPITGIVEHRDGTPEQLAIREINSGVYVFEADVLADGLATLAASTANSGPGNAQGEQYLTDLVGFAHAAGRRVGAQRCADPWLVSGVNDRVQLAEIRAELNRRLLVGWMRAGVTVIDPATTWVDVRVRLGQDVTLHPNTQLHGATTVAEAAEIGPDTTLTDCRIGAGARVVRTHGSGADIGAGASVGPYAYLRPGARLGESGKIGTFVEVKNSDIGPGTKVPHLTYVGDATIGERSNIGASSVFVNYDGVAKHRTVVGSHVRTGSDNTFVAPVNVGDGAYTGAGAVIRQDVPPGALAVSAGEQRNIEGWVNRRRPGTPAALAAEKALSDPPGRVDSGAPSDTVSAPTAGCGGGQLG